MTEEQNDFQQAMKGVRRLSEINRAPMTKPAIFMRHKTRYRTSVASHDDLNLAPWETLNAADRVRAQCNVSFQHQSATAKQLTRLRRGDFSTPCVIDLHGLSETKAEESLTQWLLRCRHKSPRYALIIHGKGLGSTTDDPVLKNFINWWLRNQPRILAFCSALPADGGTGAVYALLAGT